MDDIFNLLALMISSYNKNKVKTKKVLFCRKIIFIKKKYN